MSDLRQFFNEFFNQELSHFFGNSMLDHGDFIFGNVQDSMARSNLSPRDMMLKREKSGNTEMPNSMLGMIDMFDSAAAARGAESFSSSKSFVKTFSSNGSVCNLQMFAISLLYKIITIAMPFLIGFARREGGHSRW